MTGVLMELSEFDGFLHPLIFFFAIVKINRNPDILPNITLGYNVYDSCQDGRVAVSRVLHLLSGPDKISYGASDPSLSDRLLYPHVFRTIQSSHTHNMVIIELLKYFGWTWVGILVSDDDNGERELQILTKYMRENGICVAFTITMTEENSEYRDEILRVMSNPQVSVIIMCGTMSYVGIGLLQIQNLVLANKTLVLPPSWVSSPVLMEFAYMNLNVSLAVDFSSQPFVGEEDFVKNYGKLPKIFNHDYYWKILDFIAKNKKYNHFISFYRNATVAMVRYTYSSPNLRTLLSSGVTPRLYDAVEILAKSLHEMFLHIKDKYKENPITGLVQYTGKLQRYIQRMKNSRDPMSPSYYFTDQGEALHPYKIMNKMFVDEATGDGEIPVSRCSGPCLPGSRKKPRETIHICCYDCVPCSEGEISNITDADNCIQCESDEWPNEERDRCLPKVTEFLSYQNDPMASVFSGLSLFGCLVTGSIFRIFISYQDTPIVKANNRNLSYLLLVSIFLSFLSVFLFLGRPSDVTCRLRETSFGVFFSVAVSSLLAKTVMVCVAFKSTKPGSPWRRWLSVKLPYTIVLLCSSIQVVICVIWLSISPPFQDLDTQSSPGKIIIQCNEGSDICFYSMLGYMGLLAAGSFLLAFMVRTLPDSFNEAKYITFSMLLFCSVWISMIPAYLSTRGKYMVAVEIFAVMASSAGLLGCVFFPKCFIILFRSEMNTKIDLLRK
ncbi:vomeronasal type-2 receptor 26-like [Engystomops pustulosus]|uniref:vomeronasal type-2 receptor 26-like n=1 Tax=Engystomops pustulosus TaxID=76066 RepID=UPI003AFA1724